MGWFKKTFSFGSGNKEEASKYLDGSKSFVSELVKSPLKGEGERVLTANTFIRRVELMSCIFLPVISASLVDANRIFTALITFIVVVLLCFVVNFFIRLFGDFRELSAKDGLRLKEEINVSEHDKKDNEQHSDTAGDDNKANS